MDQPARNPHGQPLAPAKSMSRHVARNAAGRRSRQVELANEWLSVQTDTVTRPTKLTDDQLRLAEAATIQPGDDWQRIGTSAEDQSTYDQRRPYLQ